MLAWIMVGDERSPYVAGVFQSSVAAHDHHVELPHGIRTRSRVITRLDLALPCWIIQDYRGVRVLSPAETQSELAARTASWRPDEDGVVAALYYLDTEYRSPPSGEDRMGSIDHWHLTVGDIKAIRRRGLKAIRHRHGTRRPMGS